MIRQAFGVEERSFVLLGAQWRDLEKARDAGLGVIAQRLAPLVQMIEAGVEGYPGGLVGAIAHGHMGTLRLDDVREPILQGLIGGGLSSTEAGALVRKVIDETIGGKESPIITWAPLAFRIVVAALVGMEDEPPGE